MTATFIGNKHEVEKTPTQVNAWQIVLQGDFLGTQVFFDSDGVVGSSFHSSIISDNDTFHPVK